jgi:invasion protein IalB
MLRIRDKAIVRSQPMKRALVLLTLVATNFAILGNTLEAANDPRAAQLTYKSWIKFCFGATCIVGAEARGACNPSGGDLSIVTDEKNPTLSVDLWTKRGLEGAIRVQIDQGDPILIPHPECSGLICKGKVPIDRSLIERLKQSNTITVEAVDTNHQKISVAFPLADFAKAYDGSSAPEPKVFEETQKKMTEELAKRAEEQKRLQCEE